MHTDRWLCPSLLPEILASCPFGSPCTHSPCKFSITNPEKAHTLDLHVYVSGAQTHTHTHTHTHTPSQRNEVADNHLGLHNRSTYIQGSTGIQILKTSRLLFLEGMSLHDKPDNVPASSNNFFSSFCNSCNSITYSLGKGKHHRQAVLLEISC